jgi:hypothetical protein
MDSHAWMNTNSHQSVPDALFFPDTHSWPGIAEPAAAIDDAFMSARNS